MNGSSAFVCGNFPLVQLLEELFFYTTCSLCQLISDGPSCAVAAVIYAPFVLPDCYRYCARFQRAQCNAAYSRSSRTRLPSARTERLPRVVLHHVSSSDAGIILPHACLARIARWRTTFGLYSSKLTFYSPHYHTRHRTRKRKITSGLKTETSFTGTVIRIALCCHLNTQ